MHQNLKLMRKITTIILVMSTVLFSSCKKEGCTDENATNYVDGANKDDGTCKYSGKSIFWFDSNTAVNLAGDLLTTLEVYIDNQLVGSIEIDQYTDEIPTCGSGLGINYNIDLGNSTSKTISYTVKSKDISNVEQTVNSGTAAITGGVCKTIEIIY
jgi:hypothetical protein